MHLSSISPKAVRILSPLQVGVGVPVGCEAISILADDSIPLRCKWVLQIDFHNTIDSIDHHFMLMEVRDHIPSMVAWIECCYGSQRLLHLGR